MNNTIIPRKIKELVDILEDVKSKRITQKEAAQRLCCTSRNVRKKLKKYALQGYKGLIHGNKGRAGVRKVPLEHENLVINLCTTLLSDAGPKYISDKMLELYSCRLSAKTVRKIMTKNNVWKPKQKRFRHRSRRQRKPQLGIMVQLDGSPHNWFEKRGPRCTLLVFIDDATSKLLHLEFVTGESVKEVFQATTRYLQKRGLPLSFYVDYGSVFSVNTNNPDRTKLTQFERAMKELGIQVIHARSPQAKGRVERANRTLQDRLIKDMRLAGISNREEANRYAQEVYIPEHDNLFSIQAASPIDAHRPCNDLNLREIMCIKEERIVQNDFTISYHTQLLQITRDQKTAVFPKNKVIVKHYLDDDSLALSIRTTKLNFYPIHERSVKPAPERKVRTTFYKPAPNHPWRGKPAGKPTSSSQPISPIIPFYVILLFILLKITY